MKDLSANQPLKTSIDRSNAELIAFHESERQSKRRAYISEWIKKRGRGISIFSASGLVFLPILGANVAQAQEGPILAESISGVTNVAVNTDGSLEVTLSNGQVATVSASEVTVLANGQIAISAAAAEAITSLAALAAGAGTAAIAAAVGGLGLAAAAAGASSSDGGAPVLVGGGGFLDVVNPQALNAGGVLSTQSFAGFAPADSVVQVTINDASGEPLVDPDSGEPRVFRTVADSEGNYAVEIPVPALGFDEGDYQFVVEAFANDGDGAPEGDALGSETVTITVDTTPPVITIDTPISGNDEINIAESESALTITGETDAEDGQEVTVTVEGQSYTGVVASGAWSVTIPAGDLQGLPDGSVEIEVDVADVAGNNASDDPEAVRITTIQVDLTAPMIEIDGTLAGNNVFTKANEAAGLEVTGTTDAEDGQIVTVTYNGLAYSSDPVDAGTWSVALPPEAFVGLETGDTIAGITAQVSDAAGNPSALATGPEISVDLTGPSLSINPVSGDDVINILQSESDVTISGTADGAEDQTVTVEIAGTGFSATATVAGGVWSVILPQATAAGLADGVSFTVIADVEDAEGIAAPQATRDFATDYTAPEIAIAGTRSGEVDTPLSGDNILNAAELDQSLTIFGTTVGVEDEQQMTLQLGSLQAVSGTVTGNEWSVTIDADTVKALAESVEEGADIVLSATVSDAANNPQVEVATLTLVADLTAPVVAIDPVAGNDELTLANKGEDVLVTGTTDAEPGQEVIVTFNGMSLAPAIVQDGGGSVDLPNRWQTIIPKEQTDMLEDEEGVVEEYTLTAQVDDVAGNPSAEVTTTLTTDFSAPTIAFDEVAGDDVINAAEAEDNIEIGGSTIGLEVGTSIEITLNGTVIDTVEVLEGGGFTALLLRDDIPADGIYTLSASASNDEGVDAVPTPRDIRVDTTLPEIAIAGTRSGEVDTPLSGDNILNAAELDQSLTIFGTTVGVEDEQQVTLQLGSLQAVSGTVTGNEWSVTIDADTVKALAESVEEGADIVLSATVSDAANNPQAEVATLTLVADLTAPTIDFDPLPFGFHLNANDVLESQTITGTTGGADGNDIEIALFSGEAEQISRTVPTDPDTGDWSVTFTGDELQALPQGGLVIRAVVTDDAGNVNDEMVPASVDTVFPEVAITTIADDGVINIEEQAGGFSVSGTSDAEEGQIVTVTIDGVDAGSGAVQANGTWTAAIPDTAIAGLENGDAPLFAARVSDVAENETTSDPLTADVNLTIPTISFDTLAGDDILNIAESGQELIVSGTTTAFTEDDVITITVAGIDPIDVSIDGDGRFTTTFTVGELSDLISAADGGPIVFAATGRNSIDNAALPGEASLTLALTPPELEIVVVEGAGGADLESVINIAERAGGLEVRGTSDAIGQTVSVTLSDGADFVAVSTGIVDDDGNWRADFDGSELTGPDGLDDATTQISVTASVTDVANNATTAEPTIVETDFIAPTITIDSIESGDEAVGAFLNIAERDGGVTLSGTTTGAEDGQRVTVTLSAPGMADDIEVESDPIVDGEWTVGFDGTQLSALPDGATATWTATVSDAARNPAAVPATETAQTAFTAPTVSIDSHAVDGLVTGSSTGLEVGDDVVLTLPNVDPSFPDVNFDTYTTKVDADGNWEIQIPKHPAANRFEGLFLAYNKEFEATANVSDSANNPGTSDQGVTVYRAPGHSVSQTVINSTDVVYEIFQLEERISERYVLFYDDDQSSYEAHTARADFALTLTSPTTGDSIEWTVVNEVTIDDHSAIDVGQVNFGFPIGDISDPVLSLTMRFSDSADVLASYLLRPASPEVTGGALELFFGSSGEDSITVTSVAGYVRGMGGDDTIDLSAGGVNTVIFEPDQATNGTDTIIGFQAGPDARLPDQIGFAGLDNAELRGDGSVVEKLGLGGELGVNTGFIILTEALDAIDAAGLKAAAEGLTGEAADNLIYLLATDGDNSALARVRYEDVDDAEVEILAQFTGLDSSLVSTDEILGFNTV